MYICRGNFSFFFAFDQSCESCLSFNSINFPISRPNFPSVNLNTCYCCEHQLTQKLEITLEASELEPITQQLTKLKITLEASELESITQQLTQN
jgi:hypothetical protein